MNDSSRRTCVGCRSTDAPDRLIRLTLSDPVPESQRAVVLDVPRRAGGRGAWMHLDPDCLDRARRRRAFHRAFRAPVSSAEAEEQLRTLLRDRAGG